MKSACSDKGKIIHRLYEIYKQSNPKFERCTGISQSRLDLLLMLYNVDECSQTALQKQVNIDNAAVTRHIKQLEEKGMVTRRKNLDDNRFTLVKLTNQGRERIVAYKNEKQRFVSKVLKGFTQEEHSILLDMLTRIQDNVAEINPNDELDTKN